MVLSAAVTGRRRAFGLALALAVPLGASCVGGGDGGGGGAPVVTVESPDERCAALPGAFPPGLSFVPTALGATGSAQRLVAASDVPASVIPFSPDSLPPAVAASGRVPSFPADSDGDGQPDDVRSPRPDGVLALAPDLALVSASGFAEVLFVDPRSGALRQVQVSVPGDVPATRFARLPAPGGSALRTAISTAACIADPPPGAVDSNGAPLTATFPPSPDSCVDPRVRSFEFGYTSGVAFAAGRLFVSMSNLGNNPGTQFTQFLPGAVLVYDFDPAASPPRVSPRADGVIFTTAFNPTHVTALRTAGGRDLVLVTNTGPLGVILDDPQTDELEAGGVAQGEGSIDVIDATTLQLVATVPLGLAAPSFDALAIDPSRRVAFTGSAATRSLYAIDLAPLDALPPLAAGARPFVLDGSDVRVGGADARIFDAARPLRIPARANGAPAATCPGFTVGTAFGATGAKLFATEFCDGTLTTVGVDLSGDPPIPVPRDEHFAVLAQSNVVAPVGATGLGQPRALGSIAVRPGVPGIDYRGPDVFVLAGDPEGLLCALRIDSF